MAKNTAQSLDTSFFKYRPAYKYSRTTEYEKIEAETAAFRDKLNGVLDPYRKTMRAAFRFAVIAFNLVLLWGLLVLFVFRPVEAQTDHWSYYHWGAVAPGLLILLGLIVVNFTIRVFSSQIFRRDVREVIKYDLLEDLYHRTIEPYADFTRDDADYSSMALFELMSLRVRNITYHRVLWLIPILVPLQNRLLRFTWTAVGMAIPLVLLTAYIGYTAGKYGSWQESIDNLLPDSNIDCMAVLAIAALAVIVFVASNLLGRAIKSLIISATDLKNYHHWDIKVLLQRHDEKFTRHESSDAHRAAMANGQQGEHDHLRAMTHDMSAFIVEHYHHIMSEYLRLRSLRVTTFGTSDDSSKGD